MNYEVLNDGRCCVNDCSNQAAFKLIGISARKNEKHNQCLCFCDNHSLINILNNVAKEQKIDKRYINYFIEEEFRYPIENGFFSGYGILYCQSFALPGFSKWYFLKFYNNVKERM